MRTYASVPIAALMLLAVTQHARAEDAPQSTQKVQPTAFNQEEPKPIAGWGVGDGKSYWVPLADIAGFIVSLNIADRLVLPGNDYDVTLNTIKRNYRGAWVYDNDAFDVNQFLHPYQGNMYFNFSRSAGLNYWQSLVYTHVGSYLWETAGEATPPSINDQITTGFGGSFLGEVLFRLSSLTLETREGSTLGRWRRLAAGAISPASGFNRWAYGDRFDGVFRSRDPAVYTRGQFGVNLTSKLNSNVDLRALPGDPQAPQSYEKGSAVADFSVSYGMPGKPGYHYQRPFDYFHMDFTTTTARAMENLMVRGLLLGTDYGTGENFRGLWGLYGMYDYIAPQVFRVSSTAFGLGSAGQWWLGETTALQAEAVGGVGYGSGGIFNGPQERNYHRGVVPQGQAMARLLFNDRVALDTSARYYLISSRASNDNGEERIARAEAGITVRVVGLHGISLKYVMSRRKADYTGSPETLQTVGAVSIAYAYLGHKWFGAVDWRPEAQIVK